MDDVIETELPARKLRPRFTAGAQRRKAVEELLRRATPGAIRVMVDSIARHEDRALDRSLLDAVRSLAAQGNLGAQEVLCRLAVEHEDAGASRTVMDRGYRPHEASQRAVFLFLTGQWDAYEALDFDGSLLKTAYAAAGERVRRRVAAQARESGRLEWIEAVAGAVGRQGGGDLIDEEWDGILSILATAARWDALWRIAQEAPAFWGARSLVLLAQAGWQPENPSERESFATLTRLAVECERLYPPHRGARLYSAVIRSGAGPVSRLAASADGAVLAAVVDQPFSEGEAAIPEELRPDVRLFLVPAGDGSDEAAISAISLGPDGRTAVLARCGGAADPAGAARIDIVDIHTRALKRSFSPAGAVRELAFTPDGRLLAAGGGGLELWQPDGGFFRELIGHTGTVTALAVSADGMMLASGSADRSIRIWSLPEGHPVQLIEGHTHNVNCLAFSPDRSLLASSGKDGLRIWSLPDGTPRAFLPAAQRILSLAVTTGGRVLVTGHQDGAIGVWSLPEGKLLKSFPAAAAGPVSIAAGRLLAAGYSDGAVRLWRWDLAHLGHTPVSRMSAADLEWALEALEDAALSGPERSWLTFLAALLKWRWRFSIELVELTGAGRNDRAGAYDIEIEG